VVVVQSSCGHLAVPTTRPKKTKKASWLDIVSQAVALNNMQGTINCLTNAFEKSMVPPQEAAVGQRGDALQQMQE
jgi:hypothetical protein